MKLKNIFKFASIAVASASLLGVTSCNYLDVVPPEQAGLPDAMKTHDTALGFLYSCYNAVSQRDYSPRDYRSTLNSATDEFMLPESWFAAEGAPAYAILRNTQTTVAPSGYDAAFWNTFYDGIGQTLLFERELDGEGKKNEVWTSDEEYKMWKAEARFCRAFYHFQLLRLYGPIPLTTRLVGQDVDLNDYPGRTHFDGCVDWIVRELDEAAKDLPENRDNAERNRATSVICKALKGRVLLYAASDLWNGGFPKAYNGWKNTNWTSSNPVTGEEYGHELVSRTFDPAKWQRALKACSEALQAAENAGFALYDPREESFDEVAPGDVWVPNLAAIETSMKSAGVKLADEFGDMADFSQEEFKRAVWKLRMLATTTYNEGNHEIVWANNFYAYGITDARLPRNILTTESNGQTKEGWAGVAPTLYSVEHFLNADGTLPGSNITKAFDPLNSSAFYNDKCVDEKNRDHVTRICLNREPRFYAWIAFDGGDYLTQINDGDPKLLDMRDPNQQGRRLTERNYSATGFLSMKHVDPAYKISATDGTTTMGKKSPDVLIRLGELILNVAECQAEMAVRGISPAADDELNAGKDLQTEAIKNINRLRARAYVGPLTTDQLGMIETLSSTGEQKTWNIVEWVRNERFIELWDEGQRYFDVRRWVAGDEYLGYGKRRGLNALLENPGADFTKPRIINSQFTFHYRQYLYPIYVDQVYKNPQMVQNPGF